MNKRIRKKVAKRLVLDWKAHKAIRIVDITGHYERHTYAILSDPKLEQAIISYWRSLGPASIDLCDSPLNIENLFYCGVKIPRGLG